jgi:hypothetical protein
MRQGKLIKNQKKYNQFRRELRGTFNHKSEYFRNLCVNLYAGNDAFRVVIDLLIIHFFHDFI